MTRTQEKARSGKVVKPVGDPRAKTQIRFAGFGGQGIVLAGKILGQAAALFEGADAVMTQNYGPEARGGVCSADVIISTARIHYPRVAAPDVLVLMAEEAARTYGPNTASDAVILVNEGLVKTIPQGPGLRVFTVPATSIAEKLGNVVMANVVMLGFVAAVTRVVGCDAMKEALLQSIPPGTEKMNLAAFQAGFDHGAVRSAHGEPERETS